MLLSPLTVVDKGVTSQPCVGGNNASASSFSSNEMDEQPSGHDGKNNVSLLSSPFYRDISNIAAFTVSPSPSSSSSSFSAGQVKEAASAPDNNAVLLDEEGQEYFQKKRSLATARASNDSSPSLLSPRIASPGRQTRCT